LFFSEEEIFGAETKSIGRRRERRERRREEIFTGGSFRRGSLPRTPLFSHVEACHSSLDVIFGPVVRP